MINLKQNMFLSEFGFIGLVLEPTIKVDSLAVFFLWHISRTGYYIKIKNFII